MSVSAGGSSGTADSLQCSVYFESRCGRPQRGGDGPVRTKADKGEGGSILADILRTSFMDDP